MDKHTYIKICIVCSAANKPILIWSQEGQVNKKINKYYVEYEEDDESEGEDIEREICEETEAGFYQ